MSAEQAPDGRMAWAMVGQVLVWVAMEGEDGRALRNPDQFVQDVTGADLTVLGQAMIEGTGRHVFEPKADGMRVDRESESAQRAASDTFFPTTYGEVSRAQLEGWLKRQQAIDQQQKVIDEQERRLRADMSYARVPDEEGHPLGW